MVMLHIKLNGIMKCSNMVANILPTDPPLPPDPRGMGSIGQKSTFSEHGDVAYQNKRNHEFSNKIAIFLHAYPPPPMTIGDGVKIQLFQNMIMLHIKLKGTTNAALW